jgi:hypothetical protein
MLEEMEIQLFPRELVQEHVDHREHERRVGLRPDRYPFRRARAGDGQMRLDLHAFHAALARVGVPLDTADAAGGFHVGAEGDEIFAERRVGRDGEAVVPEFTV